MNFIYFIFLIICPSFVVSGVQERIRISFGSCNQMYSAEPMKIFDQIIAQQPQFFLWLGDAAYVDRMVLPHIWYPEEDEKQIEKKFNFTKHDPYYQKLLKKKSIKVMGVWDDHDYNQNNGGKNFALKNIIREKYLDFLDQPFNSSRRTNPGGIYSSSFADQKKIVKIILLDVRFNRDEIQNDEADMLGEQQWQWLQEELGVNSEGAKLFLIGSGTPIIPDDRLIPESWFSQSRERLFSLIRKTKKSVIFLSGDVHFGEILQYPCPQKIGYELFEVTSSGLTFTNKEMFVLFPFFQKLSDVLITSTFNSIKYLDRNFGMIDIDWVEEDISLSIIRLQIFNETHDQPAIERVILYSELMFKQDQLTPTRCHLDEQSPLRRWLASYFQTLQDGNQIGLLLGIFLVVVILLPISICRQLSKDPKQSFRQQKQSASKKGKPPSDSRNELQKANSGADSEQQEIKSELPPQNERLEHNNTDTYNVTKKYQSE